MNFDQVVKKFDSQCRLLRFWQLEGGVSARITALEIERADGQTQKLLMRQHGEIDLKRNPNIAADEYKLLHLLHSAGLSVPKPYFVDLSGEIFPTPYIVIEFIDGKTEFDPPHWSDFLNQMAVHLAKIHALDCSKTDLSFLPEKAQAITRKLNARPALLDESLQEGRIRNALEKAWPFPQLNEPVLLHGDFHLGNILWKDEQLAAIIDWEDAEIGDPLADVANCRLELLWMFGIDAMREFTNRYQSLTTFDFSMLPYWDLIAALRPAFKLSKWGLDEITKKQMQERHSVFVEQAISLQQPPRL